MRAVVWGAASILPEQCVELHRLLIDDIDLPAARELWARLWPLCRFLESQSYPAAVKAACALVGDTTGPVRAPLLPLDDGARPRAAPRWSSTPRLPSPYRTHSSATACQQITSMSAVLLLSSDSLTWSVGSTTAWCRPNAQL